MNQAFQLVSSMDDGSRNTDENGETKELLLSDDHNHFLCLTHKDEFGSHNFFSNLLKHSLLLGADMLLMSRKPGPSPALSDFESQNANEANKVSKNTKSRGKHAPKQNRKVSGLNYKTYAIHQTSSSSNENESFNNNDEISLNYITFLTVLVLKLVGFQISLFVRFFTFPIRLLNLSLMFLMFPFQILTHLRHHVKKKVMRACKASYLRLIEFVYNRFKSQKSILKVAVRFGKAFFCSAYVFFVLVGLLVSGFVIGGIVMRNVVQESIHKTEILNFDYTKTSPVATVPISSSLVNGMHSKLKLTVSLTLPESEYNRKLGIFQVRVETLSATGKVILGSSYPTMLRFKSQPVRAVETLLNSVHLITGLKSEVQILKIVMGEFNEGYEPTASFKVIIEQRAEFEGGSGVPEIYGASLEISSQLTKLKRVIWNWRRTTFVWIGFALFMAEVMVFLIFFRSVVVSGGSSKSKAVGNSTKKCWTHKII